MNTHSCQDFLFSVFLNAASSVLEHLKVPERLNRSLVAFFTCYMNGKLVVHPYATN